MIVLVNYISKDLAHSYRVAKAKTCACTSGTMSMCTLFTHTVIKYFSHQYQTNITAKWSPSKFYKLAILPSVSLNSFKNCCQVVMFICFTGLCSSGDGLACFLLKERFFIHLYTSMISIKYSVLIVIIMLEVLPWLGQSITLLQSRHGWLCQSTSFQYHAYHFQSNMLAKQFAPYWSSGCAFRVDWFSPSCAE